MDALRQVTTWPAAAAVGVVACDADGAAARVATVGDLDRPFWWASVTKLLTTYAVLVAVEEHTVDLDEPAGPPGATLRHLLAHASGVTFDSTKAIARPGTRRIYSNTGIEAAAALLEDRSGIAFKDYLHEAVLSPLMMTATTVDGSPAHGAHGPLRDLLAFTGEIAAPTLLATETMTVATTVAFPGLVGIVPGIGRFDPCDWGLGFEIRDAKSPHWTGTQNSPRTYGHFGGSGSFVWVDPDAGVACAGLSDREFGPWALDAWPRLADAVLAEHHSLRQY